MRTRFQILSLIFASLILSFAVSAQTPKPPAATYLKSPELNTPPGYSHAVVINSGKLIYIAGQVGLNKEGQMVGKDDFKAQAAQAFENLRTALAAAGAKPENLVKLNYFVVGLNHEKLLALREVRSNFVNKEHPPASTLVGAAALFSDEAQIEIEAIAVIP